MQTKTTAKIYKGVRQKLTSDITIYRGIPNPSMRSIGSIVFLDFLAEKIIAPKTPEMPDGSFAHPHRGIATFSYIIDGSIHHLDSAGGEGIIDAGGIQWMNTGNGIVHDEFFPYDFQRTGGRIYGLQFWINLPGVNKAKSPDYMAVQGKDVPEIPLSNNSGKLRVLLGEFENEKSNIPNFTEQFMYHLTLKPNTSISLPTNKHWEYGLHINKGKINIDTSIDLKEKEVAELFDFGETLFIRNTSKEDADFMIFGGEPYQEAMVPYGPFIMNTEQEIATAYQDFQLGKYGNIDYSKVKI